MDRKSLTKEDQVKNLNSRIYLYKATILDAGSMFLCNMKQQFEAAEKIEKELALQVKTEEMK